MSRVGYQLFDKKAEKHEMSSVIEFPNIKLVVITNQSMLSASLVVFLSRYFTVISAEEDIGRSQQKIDETKPQHIIYCLDAKSEKAQKNLIELLNAGYLNTSIFAVDLSSEIQDKLVMHGVKGVLDGAMKPEHMVKAVRRLCDDEIWLDRKSTTRLIKMLPQVHQHFNTSRDVNMIKALSTREFEILKVCSQMLGATNKEIAKRLYINENSLRNYLSSIYNALMLKNRHELFLFLMRNKDQFDGKAPGGQ
jgi:DNA-binding NarL/FixJ family response regulator